MRAPVRLMPRYFTEVYRGVLCREQCIAMNRLHDHLLNSSFPCPIYYMHILYSALLYCCIACRQRFECHCEMCCANNLIIHINTLKRKYHHFDEIVVIGCSGSCHFVILQFIHCRHFRHRRYFCFSFANSRHLFERHQWSQWQKSRSSVCVRHIFGLPWRARYGTSF